MSGAALSSARVGDVLGGELFREDDIVAQLELDRGIRPVGP
jgi:hypothetical protein